MARPRIVADKNIPYLEAAFGHLGAITALPSSAIDAAAVREADLLLVRSTVKVGAPLLDGSRVRFVGSAVSGTDHVDVDWLAARGIAFASAPGSNAPSVAQWWTTAMLGIAAGRGEKLEGKVVGIVGVGNVGRRVQAVAEALGCRVMRCDPPRARAEGWADFSTLDEVCWQSDIVTLHAPLNLDGPDRTAGLFDAARIARLRRGAWLVNAARGPIVDGRAAIAARKSDALSALVLDVFEGEPAPPPELVAAADLATPHIAGHSLDGKAAGTDMVYRAACAHLGVKPAWKPARSLPPLPMAALALDARALPDEAAALAVLHRLYPIEQDDAAMRRIAALAPAERARAFQKFRDGYPVRREPVGLRVELRPIRRRALAVLELLGAAKSDP